MAQEQEIGRMIVRLVGDTRQFTAPIQNATKAIQQTGQQAQKTTHEVTLLGQSVKKLGTTMSSIAGSMMAWRLIQQPMEMFKKSINLAAEAESLETSFGTMLQSVELGREMVAQIQKFAAETPLSQSGLQGVTKMLLQNRVAMEDIIPTLRMLGDVAGGNQQKLNQLAYAFGQVKTVGRLMGGELIQLMNAGFNPLQELSRTSGKSMAELRAEMEDGKITFEMVAGAFKSATSHGGLFFEGMQKESKTFSGLLSTMEDDTDALFRSFGKTVIEGLHLKEVVAWVSEALQAATNRFNAMSSTVKTLVSIIGVFMAAFTVALVAWKVGSIVLGMFASTIVHVVDTFAWLTASARAATAAVAGQGVAVQVTTGAMGEAIIVGNAYAANLERQVARTRALTAATVALRGALLAAIAVGSMMAVDALTGGSKFSEASEDRVMRMRLAQVAVMTARGQSQTGFFEGLTGQSIDAQKAAVDEEIKKYKDLVARQKEVIESAKQSLSGEGTPDYLARSLHDTIPAFGREAAAEYNQTKQVLDSTNEALEQANEHLSKLRQKSADLAAGKLAAADDMAWKKFTNQIKEQGLAFGMAAEEATLFRFQLLGVKQEEIDATRRKIEAINVMKEAVKAQEAEREATRKLAEEVRDYTRDLETQIVTMGMNAEERKIYEMGLKGATPEQLANARALQAMNKELRYQAEIQEEINRTIEQFRTPQEEYEQRISDLAALFMEGLPQETFDRAMQAAADALDRTANSAANARQEIQRLDGTMYGSADHWARVMTQVQMFQDARGGSRPSAVFGAGGAGTGPGGVAGTLKKIEENTAMTARKPAVEVAPANLTGVGGGWFGGGLD